VIHCGGTFFLGAPGFGNDPKGHLWVVVTEPAGPRGECLIVSISTLRSAHDQTVPLQRGDHPFIHRPSYVCYRMTRIVRVTELELLVQNGQAEVREPITGELLRLIQDGILASEWTPRKCQRFYETYRRGELAR